VFGLRAFAPAFQPVVQLDRAGAAAPAHVGAVVLDVAHALHAAGQHHVGRTGLHHHRGGGDGLHAAAAAAVQLHAADLDRKARLQRHPAAGAGRFAAGVALREHHVVDARRVQPGALHHRARDDGAQLFHRHARSLSSKDFAIASSRE
jgi:hypothetical protein